MRQKTIDRAKPQMKNKKRMDQEAKRPDPENEAGARRPLKPGILALTATHLDAVQCQTHTGPKISS